VERRRNIAASYRNALESIPGLRLQAPSTNKEDNGYWVVGIVLEGHGIFEAAVDAMTALGEAGVATRPFFYPLHKQPLLDGGYEFRTVGDLPVATHLGDKGFYVPNGLGMSDGQLAEAVSITQRVLRGAD
jgi:perosamine synthetase